MTRWTHRQQCIALANYKHKTAHELGLMLNKKPKAVAEWLRKHKLYKLARYTDTEKYILQNFPIEQCALFIPKKSTNALKIKACRLKYCIL